MVNFSVPRFDTLWKAARADVICLGFSLLCKNPLVITENREMSAKTIAVLDEAELEDGQMYGFSYAPPFMSVTVPQEGRPV